MKKLSLEEIEEMVINERDAGIREVSIEERLSIFDAESIFSSLFAPLSLSESEEKEFAPGIALVFIEYAYGKNEIYQRLKSDIEKYQNENLCGLNLELI